MADSLLKTVENAIGRDFGPQDRSIHPEGLRINSDHIIVCKPDRFVIVANVPGAVTKDIHIELRGRTLHVTYKKVDVPDDHPDKTVTHQFPLPEDASAKGVSAKLEKGALSVEIPKMGAAQFARRSREPDFQRRSHDVNFGRSSKDPGFSRMSKEKR